MNRPDDLDVWTIAGLLHVRIKAARDWIRAHVPAEAIRREGGRLYVSRWGVNAGLSRCTWYPRNPKGYQGHVGRKPPNVRCRDSKGRFISHRANRRPPKKRKGFIHPTVRRYLSGAD